MNGSRGLSFLYLFLGQDIVAADGSSRKEATLKRIKLGFLSKPAEDFNLDILYSKELTLKGLQERLLCLPLKSAKRIIVIKDNQGLKIEVKDFILEYIKKPSAHIVLIIDINNPEFRDRFVNGLLGIAQVFRFKEPMRLDTFALGRSIDSKRTDVALGILKQLLDNGEKPEWIIGGLRSAWERNLVQPQEAKKRLKALLVCDLEIKTGRLTPGFALEKLVIGLCGLSKAFT